MKNKTYIVPTICIIDSRCSTIMAGSPTFNDKVIVHDKLSDSEYLETDEWAIKYGDNSKSDEQPMNSRGQDIWDGWD